MRNQYRSLDQYCMQDEILTGFENDLKISFVPWAYSGPTGW